jgi:molybdenum cofactor guanylyltransferase
VSPPLGVVLGGGAGKRIGGDKCTVELAGRPLLLYPIETLRKVCEQVVVVVKQDTVLPQLAGEAEVWIEPDEPRHPLAGVVHALRTASARKLLVLACDMPLVPEELLRALLKTSNDVGAVARCHDITEPLCACYTRNALHGLEQFEPGARAIDVVEALGVAHVEWDDPDAVLSVNAPEDLIRAQALL